MLADLAPEERDILEETKRTGNLDIASEYYFRTPFGGSRWWQDESVGHYRHIFQYPFLLNTWEQLGQPQEFALDVDNIPVTLTVVQETSGVSFLLKHGYLFLDWAKPFVSLETNVGMVVSGTGCAKTSSVAVATLLYSALFPGFRFMNAGPSELQAELLVKEIELWLTNSPFIKFVQLTRNRQTHTSRPHVLYTILSPYNPQYPSSIECRTIGNSAASLVGWEGDWVNIDECQYVMGLQNDMGPIMTRMRAMRPDGNPRTVKFTVISNPGDNPDMGEVKKRAQALADDPSQGVKAVVIENLSSAVNPYITSRQLRVQGSMLDALDIARWQQGDSSAIEAGREIPEVLLKNCRSEAMDYSLAQGMYGAKKRDGVGVISYQMPYQDGHTYAIVGDPGQSNAVRLNMNNVPTTMVFDITGFPESKARLAAMYLLDGNGKYNAWLDCFTRLMTEYKSPGFYDATNVRTAWEDDGTFGMYPTTPVFFDYSSKPWAKTIFVTLAQHGLFEWPYIQALWYQASIYRSYGEGVKKLADDLLASMFVFCLALRIEGTIWTKLTDMFHWEREEQETPERDPVINPVVSPRYGRQSHRFARR